ncbi:MAG: SLC13 family permease [Tepidisphaeraceae bacterium]|jgi:Na+/H+ antiporter NhaD/arsenite permease-like protein
MALLATSNQQLATNSAIWFLFALVYVGMALGRLPGLGLDRAGVAVLGAIGMIAVRAISLPAAAHAIDYETILLLFSLMLFSAQLRAAGFYETVGEALTHQTARPKRLLAGMMGTSALLSALLANDIVCLAFTPVLCAALLKARRNPIPYLIALAISSNIGSAATLIGNPQNMYIGVVGRLPFAHFAAVMIPVTIVALLLAWTIIMMTWRGQFWDGVDPAISPLRQPPQLPPFDRRMVFKTLAILLILVIAFLYLPAAGRVIAALAGGGLLLISRRKDSARLYQSVDWNLLLLFVGLFVVNGTMKQSGFLDQLISHLRRQGVDLHRLPTLSTVTTLLSNVVSNVPAVLLLQPSIPRADRGAWYVLAMSSTWAGNLTLVGSIANLIVAEQAQKLGVKLDLGSYCKAGIPITLITVAMGTVWIIWILRS